jgi:hypothetical protein
MQALNSNTETQPKKEKKNYNTEKHYSSKDIDLQKERINHMLGYNHGACCLIRKPSKYNIHSPRQTKITILDSGNYSNT